jgi:hypothetical protein
MNLLDTFGIAGVLLFFGKIGIHIYIKRSLDKKFRFGAFGQFTNPVFFFPITDDVGNNLKLAKRVGNITYFISVGLILIFLIGTNLHLGTNAQNS